ncbi:hypothetical protein KIN20_027181, partial [Parelaphostrongylus tenuis]
AEQSCTGLHADGKREDSVIHTIKETYRSPEKAATLAAIVAGKNRSKPQLIDDDDVDKSNDISASSKKDRCTVAVRNKDVAVIDYESFSCTVSGEYGRVFHNQAYYKTERMTSGSPRDIANGAGETTSRIDGWQ